MFCPMTVKSTHLIQGSVQVLHPPSKHAEGPAKYPIVGGEQKLSILFYFAGGCKQVAKCDVCAATYLHRQLRRRFYQTLVAVPGEVFL